MLYQASPFHLPRRHHRHRSIGLLRGVKEPIRDAKVAPSQPHPYLQLAPSTAATEAKMEPPTQATTHHQKHSHTTNIPWQY